MVKVARKLYRIVKVAKKVPSNFVAELRLFLSENGKIPNVISRTA